VATVADGVRVLMTKQSARPADAVLSLLSARPVTSTILVITDNEELAVMVASRGRAVLPGESLLRFLVGVRAQSASSA
jgi:hypothetical protein